MRKVVFLVLAFLAISSAAYSQDLKIGYANMDSIVVKLPEFKVSQRSLETYAKQLQNQLDALKKKGQARLEELQKDYENMTPKQQEEAQAELQELQGELQKNSILAQSNLKKRETELLAPLYEKAKKAVVDVAKEKGYTYIMNEQFLIYRTEVEDITDAVIAKLGS